MAPAKKADAPAVTIGQRFDTPFENGCIVVTSPDETGSFIGLDSDGEACSYSVDMVVVRNV